MKNTFILLYASLLLMTLISCDKKPETTKHSAEAVSKNQLGQARGKTNTRWYFTETWVKTNDSVTKPKTMLLQVKTCFF